MAIHAAYMVPHPPMIIPDVGRGSEAQIKETTAVYEQAADVAAIYRLAEVAGRKLLYVYTGNC